LEENPQDEDELMLMCLDAGAEDVKIEDGEASITTDPDDLTLFARPRQAGLKFSVAEISMIPHDDSRDHQSGTGCPDDAPHGTAGRP
jgi:transcriptional/translational regulatory protein YebC/TACO1